MDLTEVALIASVAVLVISFAYWRIKNAYGIFSKQGIPGPDPSFPFGTWTKSARISIGNEDKQNINKYGPLVGTFDGLTPNLIIADWEVIKKILKTDAAKFRTQRTETTKNLKNALMILGNDCQGDISPLLNTPINRKKLLKLFPHLEATANEFSHNLVKSRQENILPVNEAINTFAYDAISSVLLGVDLNSDLIHRQAFIKHCQELLPGVNCSSALSLIPLLHGSIDLASKTTANYFKNLIAAELKKRLNQDASNKATDFLQILLEISSDEQKIVKKEKEQEDEECLILTDEVLSDQILAAILTFIYWMRNTLLFGIYALSKNQDVQEKVYEEIKKHLENDKLNGEVIEKLPYLDGFVKEITRMYPVEARLEKTAVEDFVLTDELTIKKGTKITIPVYALHTSKQYHPDPKTFNPGRFSIADYETENPIIYNPSNTALSTHLSKMALKTAFVAVVTKLEFSANDGIYETGAPFFPQSPEIQVIATLRY